MARVTSVDEYLGGFDDVARAQLEDVRDVARTAAPQTTEAIKWGQPAWLHASGTILFMLSGYRRHISVTFTPSVRQAFDDQLGEYELGKGSVKIGRTQRIPHDLLRRMIEHRIREHEDDGVLWM